MLKLVALEARQETIAILRFESQPALCPQTATEALLMITGPYIMNIANKGLKKAAQEDASIRRCISTVKGKIVHEEISVNQEMPYTKFDFSLLGVN